MRTLVVDVDLTIVDTLSPWVEWWEFMTDSKFDWSKVTTEFSINKQLETKMNREQTLEFWNKTDLYDDLTPRMGSVTTLKWFSAMGCDIYFVSKCEEGHYDSKIRFLNKWFPFHDGLINTADKHTIEADVYFEDHVEYVENILRHQPFAKVYQFITRDNEYQLSDGAIHIKEWGDVQL